MCNIQQTRFQKNAGWFIAYSVIMVIFLSPLALWYGTAIADLYKERSQAKFADLKHEQEEQTARNNFLQYLSSHQQGLHDATDTNSQSYKTAQNLLRKIHPDLILMLGATKNNQRDLMLTSKVCRRDRACLQCLLLLEESQPLSNLRIGLGPHPHYADPVFPEYSPGKNSHHLIPEQMRYKLTASPDGLSLTLFSDALLDQSSWSKNYSDFVSTPTMHYLPSDDFLEKELGEFLRKQIKRIEIKSTADPLFAEAKPCLPAQSMREDVARQAGYSLSLPVVSKLTHIFHSQEREKTARLSTSSWSNDRWNWSYYFNNIYPKKRDAANVRE